MANFSFVLLYVADPAASAKFYAGLLEKPIVQQSPTFCMLPLTADVMLGLWVRDEVEPKVTAPAGGSEIAFTLADDAAVTHTHAAWKKRGLTIAQTPTKMDFGFTFTALDPDGNRIRMFAPAAR
jgi:predicted enzyme related to lactoylglutathione lyase